MLPAGFPAIGGLNAFMAMTAPSRSPIDGDASARGRKRTVARDGALSMAALFVVGATRVLYGSMVSRATDPETYGLIGVLIAISLILSLVLPAGINSAIARYVPYSLGQGAQGNATTLYRSLLRFGLIASAGLGALAAAGAAVAGLGRTEIVEVGLLTAAYSSYVLYKAGLYGFDLVPRYLLLEILSSGTILMSTVYVVVTGSAWYLAPQVAGYSIFVVAAHLVLRAPTARSAPDGSINYREVAGYVALACVGTVASAGFLQATQVLAARFALSDAAYFTATITLVSMLYFLPRALSLALFPFMAQAHGAGDLTVVRGHADKSTRALLTLLSPVFVIGIFVSGEALVIYGGPPFLAGALILQIVLLASYLSVIQVPSVNTLSSASREGLRLSAGWAVIGAIVGLALVPVAGPLIGSAGIAVAYFIGTAVTASGPITIVWRRYRMHWTGPVIRAVGAVGIAFVAARVLAVVAPVGGVPWFRDMTAALVGVVLTLFLLRGDLAWVLRAARHSDDRQSRVGGQDYVEGSESLDRNEHRTA